jgi:type 1 glutamine amidotransferase
MKQTQNATFRFFHRFLSAALVPLLAMLICVGADAQSEAAAASNVFNVLIFSKTLGFRHDSIPNSIAAIRELGARHRFAVDATEDSGAFTPANLQRYQVVVFLSTTGDVLNSKQNEAFKQFVLNGGGFAGIHGAIFGPSATEEKWGWYGEVCCCAFTNHSSILPATVKIEDPIHLSTAGLPARWQRTDEWYNFTGTPRGCARVLATVDEATYSGGTMGGDHPIAWCRPVGKGRMWYTALGHTKESFADPLFLQHILGGIQSVVGTNHP